MNNNMKKLFLGIVSVLSMSFYGQQDAMFTHYAFNTLAVNPAYAGSRDALTVTGLHRSQWVGFEGAPTTQTLTAHMPFINDEMGVGLSIMNDKIGPVNTTSFYADFAYRLEMGPGRLAFGLKGGINLMQGQLSSLSLNEGNDMAFQNNIQSDILPNFGFGAYYSSDRWYAGLSTPRLLENDFKSNTTTGTITGKEKRHFYLIGGSVFNLKDDGSLKIKPTTLVKVTQGAPIEADLTAMLIIKDKIEAGLMGRTGDAMGLLVGYNFNSQLRFGYSFDWSFVNATGRYNAGSHEVMLRYDVVMSGKGKIRSPRYF